MLKLSNIEHIITPLIEQHYKNKRFCILVGRKRDTGEYVPCSSVNEDLDTDTIHMSANFIEMYKVHIKFNDISTSFEKLWSVPPRGVPELVSGFCWPDETDNTHKE